MQSIAALEARASKLSKRGDMQAAVQVCKDILAIDANHLSSLRFLADLALQSADFAAAVGYLAALRAISPGDLQVVTQFGQALYRLGELEQAIAAYTDYWRINPGSAMIYLTLGCLYAELGNTDKAAQVFSLGEAADPKLLSWWKKPDINPGVAHMSRVAWQTLCRHHTELHLRTVDALGDSQDLTRIRDAIWPLLDARPINYEYPKKRPQVFSIRFASSPTFFDASMFSGREQLEREYHVIREEILAGLNLATDGRPYLGDSHQLEGPQWEPLVNRMDWASVHLYRGGAANQKVIDKFPATARALAQLPLATINGGPSEVFISVLAPRTRIPEHFGVSSATLTAHLPIEIPQGCGLKVHRETRSPERGKLMVFDDTWEHSAWNNSARPRVVLIFEVWHPELSELEKSAVVRTFEAREHWLKQRTVD